MEIGEKTKELKIVTECHNKVNNKICNNAVTYISKEKINGEKIKTYQCNKCKSKLIVKTKWKD